MIFMIYGFRVGVYWNIIQFNEYKLSKIVING